MRIFLFIMVCFFTQLNGASDTFSFDRFQQFSDAAVEEQREILAQAGLVHITPQSSLAPVYRAGFLLVQLTNNTGQPDNAVYFIVKGQILAGNQCFLQVAADGTGSYAFVNTSTLSTNYSYRFSDLPGSIGSRFFYIPQPFISGRIYFSINYPLLMAIGSNGMQLTIVDPSAFSLTDPNYYTLYDKMEFTYNPPDPNINLYTNPTAVDFFSLPIRLQVIHPTSVLSASGMTLSRNSVLTGAANVFSTFDKTSGQVWSKLFLPFVLNPYSSPVFVTNMRLVAASIASAPGSTVVNPDHFFPSDYLSNPGTYGFNYIDDVWNFYNSGNTLNINAIEIASIFGPGPGQPAYYHFAGTVDGGGNFVFVNGTNNYTWTMAKPTSCYPFFAGANFVDSGEANNTPGAVIVRQITSAFDVGILPVNFTPGNYMDQAYFESNKANYYTNNAQWGAPGANNGPFYDLYSKALHSFGDPIYTFAYDDELGQDGTLTGNVEVLQSSLTITLGAVDTPIPDPFDDNTLYTVAFQAAANNPVQYRNGTSGSWIPAPAFPGTVSNISSNRTIPFQIMLKDTHGVDQILTVYLEYNIVIPQIPDFSLSSGVVIQHTAPNPATNVTLQTPAQ